MLSTENKRPIEIGILEISSQNKAILEFFFSGAGKSYFKEVTLDKASAYISLLNKDIGILYNLIL